MNISPLSGPAVRHVVDNMREWDRREIFATRFYDDPQLFTDLVMASGSVSWIADDGGPPIAAFGCAPMWPGVWSMWFFATDELTKIGISVTRMIIRGILPMMWSNGAHRLECRSMDGHTEAQAWLECLGAHREGTLKAYGSGGEDFHCYVWRRP